jgi:CDP-archaeol synthase
MIFHPDGMQRLGALTVQVMYLFLPLLCGAAISGIVLRYDLWPALARPMDAGLTFRGRRLFGDNKTWRGLACSLIGCMMMVAVQRYLIGDRAGDLAVIDYAHVPVFTLGTALGAGAILGELPNSFLKRQLDIPPGENAGGALGVAFYVFDQVDLLAVTWPLLLFWVRPEWSFVLISVAVIFVAHQLVTIIGYMIGALKSGRKC